MKKIIYIYDSACPWCYAFTPIVKQLYDNYKEDFDFEILSGGLILGDRIKLTGKKEANYRTEKRYKKIKDTEDCLFNEVFYEMSGQEASNRLREGYKKIEETTGCQFGNNFFEMIRNEEVLLTSELPAIALAVFRDCETSFSPIEFIGELSHSIFLDGRNPSTDSFYKDLAMNFEIEPNSFIKKMKEDYYKQQAHYDFTLAKQLKAEAFPRLYLQTYDDYFYLISKGYSDYDDVIKIIGEILN
ncbi:hypothetical protein R0131_00480 [Clostridium sp. AL.422]|uniref:DsbA family protein n=1 Tax=Clostridium TaxID=1485 RepID=UPI00293DC119|nr:MULTISPECIES: hypothetical protein [unclassified Clostridium]MDV4149304.1 hypothetical protein [Clostridium sp. AL.422]